MYEAENVDEPPHQQSYFEHETGAESWANHEVQYEQQQHNYYEPHQSPHQQPSQHCPFDFQVFQEQQQQGFKAMTDMITNMQIETLNYFENIKTYQEYQYDQMKSIIAQQQEVIATQNREFQAMKRKQDQLEKELSEIKKAHINPAVNGSNEELQRLRKIIEDQRVALVQHNRVSVGSSQVIPAMAASSEEKLDKIASSVAEFKEELTTFKERHEQLANLSYKQYTTIGKEQESMAKEVKEIKENQINPVDNETLKDVARMTFEQRGRAKANQEANEGVDYMVYDNLENKKPMFSGALKSDSNAGQVSRSEPIPPEDLHLYNNQQ
ncbi:hypothetical protein PIB30_097659, partial [Stylosanthes scabra]|nr:hypothetical protein [Stylosanthes scabra]